jgi:hypothetical protein
MKKPAVGERTAGFDFPGHCITSSHSQAIQGWGAMRLLGCCFTALRDTMEMAKPYDDENVTATVSSPTSLACDRQCPSGFRQRMA